jgi:2-oxoacid:acceptor oxidoreductase gamma subunit (pyruvate/2-ketoisovalerate family)/2-oxoacid:acceptor oxidoreductase delta subunit (pyruvate/2-ketoisovalerate family)
LITCKKGNFNMVEIRGHARGGQGMVTAFEILAKIFSQLGDYQVQSFPAFGVERTGAPIQAFLRVAHGDILNRSNVYNPHLVIIFDENLLDQVPVFSGLHEDGFILINTERPPEDFKDHAPNIFTIPATNISIEHGLGSKSLPIVNAAMIGAIMRIFNANPTVALDIIRDNVPAKPNSNVNSAKAAYNYVYSHCRDDLGLSELLEMDPTKETIKPHDWFKAQQEATEKTFPHTPAWDKPMTVNKTGTWRVLMPKYKLKEAPCSYNCPAGTNVREFVDLISENKMEEAYDVIYEHNPFAATCGRVCPHFCEQNCNRKTLDEGLNIGALERFLGEQGVQKPVKPKEIAHREKIAVIGAGPAGLTAALRLRQKGYPVVVYEALSQAGGMMRTGIPEFRLPNNILDSEIQKIEREGVEIRLNSRMKISELEKEYDAIIAATGSHVSSKMGLENEGLAMEGIQFLYDVKIDGKRDIIEKGDRVLIVGGGNTAIDVSRTVLRLGGKSEIHYRRTRKEMPAISHEVYEAEAEGVQFEFLTAPVFVKPLDNGKLEVQMIDMELGEPDESGRRRPVPVKGSERIEIVDKLISAIGQRADSFAFGENQFNPVQGRTEVNSKVPVFCSGDMAWGGTVTEAIGSGNAVAKEVLAHLRNEPYAHDTHAADLVLPENINFAYYLPTPSHHNPFRKEVTIGDFSESVSGLAVEDIKAEAQRCLHCGDCYECGNCFNYCPDGAIYLDDQNRLRIDYDYCKGCGICFKECPCSAIELKMEELDA